MFFVQYETRILRCTRKYIYVSIWSLTGVEMTKLFDLHLNIHFDYAQ